MIFGEIVGGLAEHPKHSLSLQEEDLNPLFSFFSLELLLTSSSVSGAFPFALALLLLGVKVAEELAGIISSNSGSCSSSRSSNITEDDETKLLQVRISIFGH